MRSLVDTHAFTLDNARSLYKQTAKKRKRPTDDAIAFGTYAGGTEAGSQYTYRVKKSGAYGGYAIVKEVRPCVFVLIEMAIEAE